MLNIEKGDTPIRMSIFNESRCFNEHDTGEKRFKELKDDKDRRIELQKSLLQEQRSFCCYCMCSIRLPLCGVNDHASNRMNIEHFKPKKYFKELSVDYDNLIGSCNRIEYDENDKVQRTCDPKKGKNTFKGVLNPAIRDKETYYEMMKLYYNVGRVCSGDKEVDGELNTIININIQALSNARIALFNALYKVCESLSESEVELKYKEYIDYRNKGDEKGQFFIVIVYLFEHILLKSSPNYGKRFLNPHYI